MPGLAIRTPVACCLLALALLLPASALAQDTVVRFSIGRLAHAAPDKQHRVGVRLNCYDEQGCSVKLTLDRAGQQLGIVYVMLLANTREIDNVILTKSAQKLLARKKKLTATFTAEVTDSAKNVASFTRVVTIRAPKR